MKTLLFNLILFFIINNIFAQVRKNHEPLSFKITTHNKSLKKSTGKSFYSSRSEWQSIIDSTWGPGVSTAVKKSIFNSYANTIANEFDGIESLKLNWDSLRSTYFNRINDSTSKGAFSSLMTHFAKELKDGHTNANENFVFTTPLNPGTPILVIGGFASNIEHFGAVVTSLPDSNLLVLRTIENHPLNLVPGDILLGYEGTSWKVIVKELLSAGLPIVGGWVGAQSAYDEGLLLSMGLNWHLFDTIDVIKYATSDTVHISVYPLLNIPESNMVNNEQVPLEGIPFPDIFNDQYVSYGIVKNTNIGYIYVYQEANTTTDDQFHEALLALLNTEGLIIDLRLNYGGWSFFPESFEIMFNKTITTIEDSYRCNNFDFTLCPFGNSPVFSIPANKGSVYDRPISVLLGPTCISMGDITAQRLRYHPYTKFFGKPPAASMGDNSFIDIDGWTLRYSISDMFHVSNPEEYLNRQEFPIDFPVWFDVNDVANGEDTVVKQAIEWINNKVYPFNALPEKSYYLPGSQISATVHLKNPNDHTITLWSLLNDSSTASYDSVQFTPIDSNLFSGVFNLPNIEQDFSLTFKSIDQEDGDIQELPFVSSFTTIGPVNPAEVAYIDYHYNKISTQYFQLVLQNYGAHAIAKNLDVTVSTHDPRVEEMVINTKAFGDLAAGEIDTNATKEYFSFIYAEGFGPDSTLNNPIQFNVITSSDGFPYWVSTFDFVKDTGSSGLGPIIINGTTITSTDTIPNPGDLLRFEFSLQNMGLTDSVFNITSVTVPLDTFTQVIAFGDRTYDDIAPGESVEISLPISIRFFDYCPAPSTQFFTHNIYSDGQLFWSDTFSVNVDIITGLDTKDENIPKKFALLQNYPNPFNPRTIINYELPIKSKVTLTIYDLSGREIKTLVKQSQNTGQHSVSFDASGLSSGIYFYRLATSPSTGSGRRFVQSRKMVVLK